MLPSCLDSAGYAVVTGGAAGFGLEVATRCLSAGMCVAMLDVVDQARLAQVKADMIATTGANEEMLLAIRCDVTRPEDCAAARLRAAEFFSGKLNTFLFNNAGIGGPDAGGIIRNPAPETIGIWKQIYDVNVFGCVSE